MMRAWIPDALTAFAIAGLVLALATVAGALVAVRGRKPGAAAACVLLSVLLLLLSGLCGAVSVGVLGYRSLTHEETAARVDVRPLGPQRFRARVELPDGRWATYTLSGDELYVDARVLKWKRIANWFGLHTHYELDRVAGRYRDLEDERTLPRTVHSLAPDRRIDLFRLARAHARMSALLDAEYGSAAFVPADRPAAYEVRVSTTGLLVREAEPRPGETPGSSASEL